MSNLAVIGAQWGDEGKGKIVDLLCEEYDVVVRYQGGNNAGHTVKVGETTYKLHLIPSGIIHGKQCVLGNGMVIDPEALLTEMEDIDTRHISISEHAHVILFYHRLLDGVKDFARIGTTGKGIGPCYTDKVSRNGIRFVDLLDKERLAQLIAENWKEKKLLLENMYGVTGAMLAEKEPLAAQEVDSLVEHYYKIGQKLAQHITNTTLLLDTAHKEGKRVLFEGAQGALLDIDHGTYPYVTSSNPTIGGVMVGSGHGMGVENRLAIVKAYTTRVGEGPFPTELTDATGEFLRDKGREFGTTTGRPRRCGWLDLPALQYAQMLNQFTHIALTKLDILSGLETIQIAVGEGPHYEELPGWEEDISSVTAFSELPVNCQAYVQKIEAVLGIPVAIVSVGPERNQTIIREKF